MKHHSHPSIRTQYISRPKTYSYLFLLIIAAIIILVGNSPDDIYPLVTAISAFVFVVGIGYLLSAKVLFAISTGSVLVIVLQFINQLKVHYYKDKLMFSDPLC